MCTAVEAYRAPLHRVVETCRNIGKNAVAKETKTSITVSEVEE